MELSAEFSQIEPLYEGAEALVYRARRRSDRRAVIVKLPRGVHPSAETITHFEREHELTKRARGEGVVSCVDWLSGPRPMLVLEDIGGQSVDATLADGPLSTKDVLHIATVVAGALAHVHEKGIVHCDVAPANIVWNRRTGAVELIDFSIARQRPRHAAGLEPVSRLKGTLAYMAPEQTGRINRVVDLRTDLYGLGATMYHLLVGRPPFVAEQAMDMVYSIIARTPVPPSEATPALSAALSAIILRLLAKSADDRYQSAAGLRADLLRVAAGETEAFELCRDDRPARLTLSQRLHGRETELAALTAAFDRIHHGRNELVLVKGRAGIGKTRLVNELRPRLLRNRANFLSGKFDQFHGGVPYSALLAALGRFAGSLLAEPEAELRAWRRTLSDAAGDNADLLVQQVPEMRVLLGSQPAAASVPAQEAEARFALLIRRILAAIASARHPLVMFLDDLQWADLPSVRLLRQLVTDPTATSMLFIGAYREREVEAGHPLTGMIAQLNRDGAKVHELDLEPLPCGVVREMVAEALQFEPAAAPVGEVVHEKTAGNPFYVERLLAALDTDGLIARDPSTGHWKVDLEAVRALPYSENVVEFLTARSATLPAETRDALAVGAILGHEFRLRDVAAIAHLPLSKAARHLATALDSEVIVRADDSLIIEALLGDDLDASIDPRYGFAHDRVQEAAREFIDDRAAMAVRMAVADLYRGRALEGSALFDLVEHALAAEPLIPQRDRSAYAELALEAGVRAKQSAAFDASLRYLAGAWSLVEQAGRGDTGDLGKRIALEGAEAAYLAGDLALMAKWIDEVVSRPDDVLAVLRAHEIGIQASVARNEMDEAIDRALRVLRLADVRLPAHPTRFDLLRGFVSTRLALVSHPPDSIDRLPLCENPVVLAAMRIHLSIFSAAYYARPEMLPLLAFSLTRLSVREGIGPETPNGLNAWAFVLCVLGDIERGYAYGEAAMRMNERLGDRRLRHRSQHMFLTHVAFWKRPWRECRDALRDVHRGCWEGGDIEFAAFAAFMTTAMSFMEGDRLEEVAEEGARFAAAILSLGNTTALHQIAMVRQTVDCLRGRAPIAARLSGEIYDEARMAEIHRQAHDRTNLFCMGVCSTFLSYVMGDFDAAVARGLSTDRYRDGARSSVYIPFHTSLDGLANAAVVIRDGRRARAREWRRARAALRRLQRWARHGPANLAHRVALLSAELARGTGDQRGAIDGYETAIAAAERSGGWLDVALCAERAGRFHVDHGRNAIARGYLLDARQHYERWGATAKVAKLDEEFADMLRGGHAFPEGTSTHSLRSPSAEETDIDVEALLRGSAAISREIHVDDVASAVLRVAVEDAGASRGVLLLEEAGELRPHAEAVVRDRDLVVTPLAATLADYSGLPRRIISYAARTMEDVIVEDAACTSTFASDPYLASSGVRSILCLPILQQQRLVAMLYVEHAAITNAFPRERVEPLRALATQAAISLKNAQLYESLEEKVQERSRELILARQEAERQRDRADTILENVLPAPIAEELKQSGHSRPVAYPSATVLFTDFAGFTSVASRMSPEALVEELERCFTTFDAIMDECGVEKLKTIGDAYMAVGGLPVRNETHPYDAVRAALRMAEAMRATRPDGTRVPFGIRIGVHTGPLVAGVIGRRRFLYDVWGDTVNVASRMESSGEVGRVNISAATYEIVKDRFVCMPRGKIAAKGLGQMDMYFVEREKDDGEHPSA